MDYKKIIIGIIIVCVIVGGAYFIVSSNSNLNSNAAVKNITDNATNHTTNITSNATGNLTNETVKSSEHSETSSHEESEPEYGSDSYVERWDKSNQQEGDSWSYLHDQPVKTENGHEYKRMYDEDSGEGYWYQMDQDVVDYPEDDSNDESL